MTVGLRFRNVDVDLIDPQGACKALRHHIEKTVGLLRDEPDGFSFEASEQHADADLCIVALANFIGGLPPDLGAAWFNAAERYFDVGYDADPDFHSIDLELSEASISAMNDIGVKLRITLYARHED